MRAARRVGPEELALRGHSRTVAQARAVTRSGGAPTRLLGLGGAGGGLPTLSVRQRTWDATTGEPVTAPLAHDERVRFGAWSPSGQEVATGGDDGTVRVWDVSPSPATLAQLKCEAELLSAHRIEADLGSVPLTVEEMKQRWAERKGR